MRTLTQAWNDRAKKDGQMLGKCTSCGETFIIDLPLPTMACCPNETCINHMFTFFRDHTSKGENDAKA